MYHRQVRVWRLRLSLLKALNSLAQMCTPHMDLPSTGRIRPKVTSHCCPTGGMGGVVKLSHCPFARSYSVREKEDLGSCPWGIQASFLESTHRMMTAGYFGEEHSWPAQTPCRKTTFPSSHAAEQAVSEEPRGARAQLGCGSPRQVPVPVFSFQGRVNISRTQ